MKILSLVCVLLGMVSYAQLQAPRYSSGEQAVFFNGRNATSVPSRRDLVIGGEYTIAAWVYPTRRAKDWARVIGKGGSRRRNYGLWIHPFGWVLSQSYCLPSGYNVWNAKKILPLNQWSLIVGMYKPGKYHRLYIDGELLSSVKPSGIPCRDNSPVTVGKAPFHTGFIGKIKKAQIYNYAMSETQLDILEEDVGVNHIVDWLLTLNREAGQEILFLKNVVAAKVREVGILRGVFAKATAFESIAKKKMNDAKKIKNAALGKRNSACGEKDKLVPGLKKEFGTFNAVISKLRGVLGNKDLVEDSIDVTAFISLEDQAHPIAVTRVITLVKDLLVKARSQITELEDACKNAQGEYDRAVDNFMILSREFFRATKAKETAQRRFNVALGELETQKKNAAKRIEQLESEIDGSKEATNLIQSVQ